MDLDITFADPKMYTRPIIFSVTELLLPDSDILEYFCAENERDRVYRRCRRSNVQVAFVECRSTPRCKSIPRRKLRIHRMTAARLL